MALRRGVPPGRRPPAAKAGGMRVSKKQENGPVEKNAKPPGKDKSSAIVSFAKPQNMSVLVAEALNKDVLAQPVPLHVVCINLQVISSTVTSAWHISPKSPGTLQNQQLE
ncbi:PREDICTED: death-associated protein-like 1 isoform X1 [Ficedula albicollis]|uniref:death-associated protein-like 1 isoform X1 n=1 Tax=Ficedula albicollis TaxID=59894 RepID=UPI00035995E2|nr:PREDICTED: death-associated protein-like 1 isoform X1 [Ficedula albicollis]